MKVSIEDGCIGCELCTQLCPAVFQMGDEGLAEVFADPMGNEDSVREAAETCPVTVIVVEE